MAYTSSPPQAFIESKFRRQAATRDPIAHVIAPSECAGATRIGQHHLQQRRPRWSLHWPFCSLCSPSLSLTRTLHQLLLGRRTGRPFLHLLIQKVDTAQVCCARNSPFGPEIRRSVELPSGEQWSLRQRCHSRRRAPRGEDHPSFRNTVFDDFI